MDSRPHIFRRLPLRLAQLLSLGVLAIAVSAPPASAAASSGLQITPLRESPSIKDVVEDLDLTKRLGGTFARIEVRWDLLEPARGTIDRAYLARLEGVVEAARSRDLKLAVTFMGTPCWSSTAPATLTRGCGATAADTVDSYPPSDPQDYARAAAFVARTFSPTVAWLEVWNEPDHRNQLYWAGENKAKTYADLLKAAYPTIKAQAPSVKVLGGAIVGGNGAFLKAMYENGAKGQYDALSVHYYDLVLLSIRQIRAVMRAAGDRKPLWLGEFGWTSCASKFRRQGGHVCVNSGQQARNLRDVLTAIRRKSYVTGAVVYTARDNSELQFGMVRSNGSTKPAFKTVRQAFTGRGRPASVKLRLRRSGRRTIASGTGPAGDALQIEVKKNGKLRYRAAFRLTSKGTYRIKLPLALGTRNLRVRVFQYWMNRSTIRRTR